MVLNPGKCHFMVLDDSNCTCSFTRNGTTIESSKKEKVLGITIDDKLTFTSHLGNIIKKANQKLHALSRVKCHMGFEQNKLTILVQCHISIPPENATKALNKINVIFYKISV